MRIETESTYRISSKRRGRSCDVLAALTVQNMVIDRITDGKRIGQLLASEIHGHERDGLGELEIADADRDAEPTESGAFAFAIESDGDRIAEVYVHPDRLRVEFSSAVETVAEAGTQAGLRVRPKAVEPPRTIVFVESGAEAKAMLRVVRAVADDFVQNGG